MEPGDIAVTEFADIIAARIRAEHVGLAGRWFDRLTALLPVDETEVFPSASLLDHIPALIIDISEYLRSPEKEAIAANTGVIEKARELGALRHGQRASLHQVLREYQLLADVLVTFVQEETHRLLLTPPVDESIQVVSRLHDAANVLMQETVETFVRLYTRTIAEQAQRLEEFTRMATHEWRQPLGSLQFAVGLLRQPGIEPARIVRTLDVAERSLAHLVELTGKVERMARLTGAKDDPIVQEVALNAPALEAARQLRDMAQAHDVEVQVNVDTATVIVDVGRLELTLLNLLSNGIKYADPHKTQRVVEVVGTQPTADQCVLVVRDNGIGIPGDRLDMIFRRFSRAHFDRDDAAAIPGLGLGLSIVEDCVRALGGRIEVQSQEGDGATFTITLPTQPPQAGRAS